MTGRDFDPFGSLGPINPQEPDDANDPAAAAEPVEPAEAASPPAVDPRDSVLPHGFGSSRREAAAGAEGDLAPWKPPARPARSPFTPVPGAPDRYGVRDDAAAVSGAAGEGTAAAVTAAAVTAAASVDPVVPVIPAVPAEPVAPAMPPVDLAEEVAEEAPELMFFPVAEEPAGADVSAATDTPAGIEDPAKFDDLTAQAAADAALFAEPERWAPEDSESDEADDDDSEFGDPEEFLRSLTAELGIDVDGLEDPKWASDPVAEAPQTEPVPLPDIEAAAALDAPPEFEIEPEPAPEVEPALATLSELPLDEVPFISAAAPLPEPEAEQPNADQPDFDFAPLVAAATAADSDPVAGAAPAFEPLAAAASPVSAAAASAPASPVAAASAATPAAASGGVRRWLPYAAAVAIPLLFGGALWATAGGSDPVTPPPAAQEAPEAAAPAPAPETPIRVLAMGDMLPHDSVNQNAMQPDGSISYAPFFDGIQANLAGADGVFCNQEVPSAGVDFGISGYPTFNAYAEFSRDLREAADCRIVNLATNHTADKGFDGIVATRTQWDGLDTISVSGANRSPEEQNTIQYGEVRGVKTALVSFAEYSNAPIDGVSLNFMADDVLVERLLTEARANAQLVIVSAHWGTEDSHDVNDQQRAFAQRVADLGADVVLGTGPHVLQPVEWVPRADGGQTLVWYSLGNMLNTQLGLDQRVGIIASFDVIPGAEGGRATVENPTGVLTWMHYDWTPEEEAALQLDARHALSLQPLAASAELLARTTYGVTPEQVLEQSAAYLGPVVTLNPGV